MATLDVDATIIEAHKKTALARPRRHQERACGWGDALWAVRVECRVVADQRAGSHLLELVKAMDPTGQLDNSRPKAILFRLPNLGAELKHQARRWIMKLFKGLPQTPLLVALRQALANLALKLGTGSDR